MNYRDFLQKVIYAIINPLIKGMIAVGITPNIVTFVGFLGNIVAAGFFLDAAWMLGTEQADYASCMVTVGWGGFIILAAGLFDMMDGRLARMSGKSSLFGALWDSTLDRYSELVSLFGICLIFVRMQGDMTWFWMGVVTERVVVTAVTAMITGFTGNIWWLAGGMILIAVLANITAFWRIWHCYVVMNSRK